MTTTRRFHRFLAAIALAAGAVAFVALATHELGATPPERPMATADSTQAVGTKVAPAVTVDEARERAELLHETLHAALQVVHHEYYREDEGLAIPALTLKKVFRELATRKNVRLRWLVVDAAAMNTDHLPQNEFERQAVAALASGKDSFERVDAGNYLHAARITLGSECLKCHLPNRKSSENRSAGLVIGIPLAE